MLGQDYLGLAHPSFPVKQATELTPAGTAIGAFDDPFGDVIPALRTMLASGKFPAVRIHAHWDNGHKIVPLKKLKAKLPRYEKLAKDFPTVKVYVSHSCEYKESKVTEVQKRVDLVRKLCPSCIPVNACWTGATIPGVITETHGTKAKAKAGDLVSTDGDNIFDIDAEAWVTKNARAEIIFLWGARYNLREAAKPDQKVPDPKNRNAAPSGRYIQACIRLGSPKGTAPQPTFTGKITPVKDPILWKTFAEDDQEPNPADPDDPRENRPVFICPSKAKSLDVVTFDGKSIGKIMLGGGFPPNLSRYYSGGPGGIGGYGAEIAQKALKSSGSEFVWLKDGKTFFGPVNPAFRQGYFR